MELLMLLGCVELMSTVTGEHVHIELIQLSGDYKGN